MNKRLVAILICFYVFMISYGQKHYVSMSTGNANQTLKNELINYDVYKSGLSLFWQVSYSLKLESWKVDIRVEYNSAILQPIYQLENYVQNEVLADNYGLGVSAQRKLISKNKHELYLGTEFNFNSLSLKYKVTNQINQVNRQFVPYTYTTLFSAAPVAFYKYQLTNKHLFSTNANISVFAVGKFPNANPRINQAQNQVMSFQNHLKFMGDISYSYSLKENVMVSPTFMLNYLKQSQPYLLQHYNRIYALRIGYKF